MLATWQSDTLIDHGHEPVGKPLMFNPKVLVFAPDCFATSNMVPGAQLSQHGVCGGLECWLRSQL